jgi:hypothetical protein
MQFGDELAVQYVTDARRLELKIAKRFSARGSRTE